MSYYNSIMEYISTFFETKDYNYNKLLESPTDYKFGMEKINEIDLSENLVKTINNFMKDNNLFDKGVIVSLSGGVDSMVVLCVLLRLQKEESFPIYTTTINYNLRQESKNEVNFLLKFAEKYDMLFPYSVHLENTYSDGNQRYLKNDNIKTKRSEFEEESRNVRYNSYKEIISEHNCKGVMVGHHQDDIIENIFTNSMKGHSILDLEVMKEVSNIKGVNIYRPLLNHRKCEVFKFAHKYDVPYFLDTTPKWSRRGKMRNEIFPLFTEVFSDSWKNKFKELGTQSNNWNKTIDNLILKPWMDEVIFGKYGFILPIKYTDDLSLWKHMIPKLFFKINYNTIRTRTIVKTLDSILNNEKRVITLDSGFKGIIVNDNLVVYNQDDIIFSKQNNSNNVKKIEKVTITNIINGEIIKISCFNNINKIILK